MYASGLMGLADWAVNPSNPLQLQPYRRNQVHTPCIDWYSNNNSPMESRTPSPDRQLPDPDDLHANTLRKTRFFEWFWGEAVRLERQGVMPPTADTRLFPQRPHLIRQCLCISFSTAWNPVHLGGARSSQYDAPEATHYSISPAAATSPALSPLPASSLGTNLDRIWQTKAWMPRSRWQEDFPWDWQWDASILRILSLVPVTLRHH